MTEILYCPVNNELLLFDGMFEVDKNYKTITIYVISNKKLGMSLHAKDKKIKVDASKLVHIGWL